jgi:hypothetical protein
MVNLASFSATGNGKQVRVDWETSSEIDNLGFNLYRSMEESGGYTKLNKRLIPGLISSPTGRSYTYVDDDTIEGKIYYYRLEDIDLSGKPTLHGPVTPVLDKTLMFPEQSAFPPLSVGGITQAGRQRTSSRTTAPSIQRVTTPSPIGLQWDLAGSFAIKMSVTERGWYRVTQAELVAAGLDPKVNPRFLRLFVDGKEQPIRVKGQSDGRFGKNDFIEFYGEGIDTLSTDTRVYWLVVGETRSKRISNVSSQRNRQEHPSIPFTVEIKERSLYFSALLNGEEDNFFGPVIWNDPVERAFDVRHLDPAYTGNAILTVRLQGVTLKPHQVQVLLNSVSVGEVVFDGQAHKQVSINVSQSVLLEGENHITLVPQGGDLDMTLLDTVRLTYQRTFMAEADELGFILSSPGHITIDGFSSRPIRVADVTDPEAVKLVSGTSVSENPPGYSVRFGSNPRNGSRTFYAFSEAGIKRPVEIKANRASTWHHEGQGADLVIISPSDFMDSLAPLKTLRESQGFSVALIDVEDLYDEFSYGTKTPQAIKDFLTRANTSWQTPPRFVLLAGGASFDPRNYLDFGNMDFLPTKLLDTAYMETASDDWFVDFNGDGLPDIAVGRLPVQTAEEATQVVSKLIAYDHAAAGGWATEVLMVADQNDTFDFEGTSQEVSALIPGQMTVWSVYRGQAGDAAARTAILGSINEGKLIVNYIGHGAVDLWKASVLTASDPPSLLNGSALPFVVGMTCLNGFFQSPYVESLAEALLKAENGGAVGIWTSSGLTVPNEQSLMNKELMRLLLNGQGLTLGEATARAKAATQDMDVRRSWILFGDPTTKLK